MNFEIAKQLFLLMTYLQFHLKELFSADIFIVTSSSLFSLQNKQDLSYIQNMAEYVELHKLNEPFPLRCSLIDKPEKLYLPIRHFAPEYMGLGHRIY